MNRYFICLLLIGLGVNTSQAQDIFRIDSLPSQGILLDKGWKWHAGDNPNWAKPEFNDSKWESIDPTQDITKLSQIRKAGLGWLRLRIRVDSSLKNKIVSIVSDQAVASEFYWDDGFIGNFGIVSSNPKNVKAYNPIGSNALHQILHFYTGSNDEHVFAIRFSIQSTNEYREFWFSKNSFLKINFFLSDEIENNVIKDNIYEKKDEFDVTAIDYFKSGLFFVLGLLHLFAFFSYRLQKANLYFGISCLLGFIYFLIQPITEQHFHFVSERESVIKLFWFIYFPRNILMLAAIYTLFSQKKLFFYSLVIFSILYLIYDNTAHPIPYYAGTLLGVLINLDATRVAIVASKNKSSGAYFLLIGTFSYIIFMSASLIVVNQNKLLLDLLFNVSHISIPISITLFLAREFARTTRSLAVKLIENETLFTEKQQILAGQNETLEQQVKERTAQLNQSLTQLKTTQNQLIQKGKLASLGELTAGIAHEIQNPLNFVNNFAEVSVELAEELQLSVQDNDAALTQSLSADLRQNMTQIVQNGQRAANIVRAMLDHSQTTTGERQAIDLNALAGEYLKLAYYGFRAKDSLFTATLHTDFATELPPLEGVVQDLSRVLLNLYNNAFYAIKQRLVQETTIGESGAYEPTLWVSTRLVGGHIELRVRDNGPGIPTHIQEKVFQPFFTTKPTGQGTGLGLSLSYDIITRGHGGEMSLESQEGQGTTFIISLPIHNPS